MNTATHSTQEPTTRAEMLYPGEDSGNSLAGMAQRDLHAALQLLAERAQYITGASGAAIALRRGGHNDMLCHASAGSNAPELGALLSAESGLSGESVRTRQPLRCDDAESDPRVNRQSCRELGIASVVVMPIVSEDQVLGVFELFSGRPKAFDERDLSALQRLGEMVETAVQHARAASLRLGAEVNSDEAALPTVTPPPPTPEPQIAPPQSPVELQTEIKTECAAEISSSSIAVSTADSKTSPESASVTPAPANVPEAGLPARDVPSPDDSNSEAQPVVVSNDSPPKRAILWSAPATGNTGSPPAQTSDSMAVPPALRNVHRCQACGFPVSEGRVLCVDCEEKKWRGEPLQRLAKAHEPPTQALAIASGLSSAATAVSSVSAAVAGNVSQGDETDDKPPSSHSSTQPASREQMPVKIRQTALSVVPAPPAAIESLTTETTSPGLFLSAGMESQSWWAANKYVFAAVSIVGIVIVVIAWMH
jgi:GAF domain